MGGEADPLLGEQVGKGARVALAAFNAVGNEDNRSRIVAIG